MPTRARRGIVTTPVPKEPPVPPRTRTRRLHAHTAGYRATVVRDATGLTARVDLLDAAAGEDTAPALALAISGSASDVLAVLVHAADELRVAIKAELDVAAAEVEALRRTYTPGPVDVLLGAMFAPADPTPGAARVQQWPLDVPAPASEHGTPLDPDAELGEPSADGTGPTPLAAEVERLRSTYGDTLARTDDHDGTPA